MLLVERDWSNFDWGGNDLGVSPNFILSESDKAVSAANFIPFVRILEPFGNGCRVTTSSEEALFCWGEWGLRVDEEPVEFWRELDGREEEMCWWVDSSWWGVGWIILAAYVACVKRVLNWAVCNDCVQPLENSVDGSVPAAPVPPTFDDTFVISVCDEIVSFFTIFDEASNEAFKCDRFSPSDISLAVKGLPARYETPCSPSVSDGDGNADFWAGVWVAVNII
jgi:hypothetical protein